MRNGSIKALVAAGILGGVTLTGGAAWAEHAHFIETPAGCHQLGQGQTSIDDPDHGGYHRYHDNVHKGGFNVLGNGHSQVTVQKAGCP